jgi:CHASE2 domain-containing sensor protein
MASILFVFEHFGWLNWLDNVMLRIVEPTTHELISTDNKGTPPDSKITVVGIDQKTFEQQFNETSPLDQKKLAQIIDLVSDQKPKRILVDIDVSPTLAETRADSHNKRALDQALINAAKNSKLLLVLPRPSISEDIIQAKWLWAKSMCAAGIEFTDDALQTNQGTFIKYDPSKPTLGVLGAHIGETNIHEQNSQHELVNIEGVCKELNLPLGIKLIDDVFRSKISSIDDSEKEIPLNFKEVQKTNPIWISWLNGEPMLNGLMQEGSTIILGGLFGPADYYQTPVGNLYGVQLHALTYLSEKDSIHVKYWEALFLDLVFGVFLGFVYTFIWRKTFPSDRKSYFLNTVGILSLLLVIVVGFSILISFMALLITKNLWLNASPLLIGMLLDSYKTAIESTQKDDDEKEIKIQHEPHNKYVKSQLMCFISTLLGLPSLVRKNDENYKDCWTRRLVWLVSTCLIFYMFYSLIQH